MASAGLPFESTKQPQSLSLFVTYISMSGTGTKGARFSFSSRFKDLNSTNILFNFFPFFFFHFFFPEQVGIALFLIIMMILIAITA